VKHVLITEEKEKCKKSIQEDFFKFQEFSAYSASIGWLSGAGFPELF
jgi:hypothetical protein